MTLEGRTVVDVREMNDDEIERMSWPVDAVVAPTVLVLDDETVLFPVSDTEGNSAGVFLGTDPEMLEGATITNLAPMSDAYMDPLEWGDSTGIKPTCIEFDAGAIYPAKNDDGTNYGQLRGYDAECGPHETFDFRFTPA